MAATYTPDKGRTLAAPRFRPGPLPCRGRPRPAC